MKTQGRIMLVKVIKPVPKEIFDSAAAQIQSIDWSSVFDPIREKNAVFATSRSIPMRRPKLDFSKPIPKTVAEWSMITECENHPTNYNKYTHVARLCEWIMKEVEGIALGRIQIVNLAPRGTVSLHVDPLDYFEKYSRFHVPIKTNANVVFNSGPNTVNEHMPQGTLCRLNNRLPHQLENNSDEIRIHVIADIECKDGNQIF